jgi:hypothetical protein
VAFTQLKVVDLPPDEAPSRLVAAVFVRGQLRLPYGQLFDARFDDLPVLAVSVDSAGTGFSGYLTERPAEGARLIVEFEGQEPIDTGLVYQEEEPPVA